MAKEKSIKELLKEFEEVVTWFEESNDELDVEKATAQYKKGVELSAEIKERLTKAKNEIEVVNK